MPKMFGWCEKSVIVTLLSFQTVSRYHIFTVPQFPVLNPPGPPCIVSRLLFRSLHDLSCQFGTRGFTKQMRQIAGGSKAGLRKFLLQYPSLFAIQNDTVQVAKIPPRSKSVSYFELPKVIWGSLMMLTVVWKLLRHSNSCTVFLIGLSFQSKEKRMKISDMTITDSGPGIRKFKMKKKHFTYGVLGIKIG